jgi:predicted GIY-YIG superfamily endonuclease
MLRDKLRARLAEMGDAPDYQRLAAAVLGIKNAPPDLARRLVMQALVVEDRQEVWRQSGERICADAPASPAVYVLRDENGVALYVGKSRNVRRRLRAHFARRRWSALKPGMARVADAEWEEVGSELEAMLRETVLIQQLHPVINVQTQDPVLATRNLPAALLRDVIVLLPSIEEDSAELLAARADGPWMIQRTRRSGADLAVHTSRVMRFYHSPLWLAGGYRRRPESAVAAAPIVFSWLAGRGAGATRLDPHEAVNRAELSTRLIALLKDEQLFMDRIDQRQTIVRHSGPAARRLVTGGRTRI